MVLHERAAYPMMRSVRYMLTACGATIQSCSASGAGHLERQATWGTFRRPFHSTGCRASGSLLNLSGLSISRESRFLSKERGIPRTEFSPHLELIRSSEVHPFRGKEPPFDSSNSATPESYSNQCSGTCHSRNHLIKELENARRVNATSQAALEALNAKYKSREKESTILASAIVVLILGLLFSRDMWDSVEPVRWHFRNLHQESSSLSVQLLSGSYTPSDDQSQGDIDRVDLEEHRTPIPVPSAGPRSVWSQLFWASPG